MSPRERLAVLVAEDDHALREAMVSALSEEGHYVDEAANGAVALEKALMRPPVVAVVDFHMPVTDGRSLIESLRLILRPRPAILGISGYPSAARWSADHGVDIFQCKPFGLETFLRAVEHAAQRADAPSSQRKVASGCVLAVGLSSDAVTSVLPPGLRHSRVVVVESVGAASLVLLDVVPELVVVADPDTQRPVIMQAEARRVPWLVARPQRTSATPLCADDTPASRTESPTASNVHTLPRGRRH